MRTFSQIVVINRKAIAINYCAKTKVFLYDWENSLSFPVRQCKYDLFIRVSFQNAENP